MIKRNLSKLSTTPRIIVDRVYTAENLDFLKTISSEIIDLIYIDPPFCTDEDYIEFCDKWESIRGYIGYMRERLVEMHRILKQDESFYIQCDKNAKFELKLVLDKIFGKKNFQDEIIWNTGSPSGFKTQKKGWIRQHDTILFYTKSSEFTFNKQYQPYSINKMFFGTVWNDVLSFQTRTRAKEYTKYPTQKPLALLKRIIRTSSNEGDLVADFFCGSGTSLVAAKLINRNFLGCDNNPNAIGICQKRLGGLH